MHHIAQNASGILHDVQIRASTGTTENINSMIFDKIHCRLGNVNTTVVLLENIIIIHDISNRGYSKPEKTDWYSIEFTLSEIFVWKSIPLGRSMPRNIKPPPSACLLILKFWRFLENFQLYVPQLIGPSWGNFFSSEIKNPIDYLSNPVKTCIYTIFIFR